jgi:hypothetical protein
VRRSAAQTGVHADSASLDYHMDVAGRRFGRFADLLTLSSIHIYGEPSDKALARLRDKVRRLGSRNVIVHGAHAGFNRFLSPEAERPMSADRRFV